MGQGQPSPAGSGRMRAAVLHELPAAGFSVEDIPTDQGIGTGPLGDDEVIIEVSACGVCGTDLHILDGHSYLPPLPFVMGHESVGTVVSVGAQQRAWLGRLVAVSPFHGCGRCALCRAGDARLCGNGPTISGIAHAWGGFATHQKVSGDQLVAVPPALDPVVAASIVDSGPTALNAARVALGVGLRHPVIIGGGSVGRIVATLLAREVGCVVVEPSPSRRALLDGRANITTAASLEAVLIKPDVVVECSGQARAIEWALDELMPQGTLILAGYARADTEFASVSRKELTIRGIRSGTTGHLREILQYAVEGAIELPEPTTWPLADINQALARLRAADPPAKAVIVTAPSVTVESR